MVDNILNENEEIMNRDQNLVVGERIIGSKPKESDFLSELQVKKTFTTSNQVFGKFLERKDHAHQ